LIDWNSIEEAIPVHYAPVRMQQGARLIWGCCC